MILSNRETHIIQSNTISFNREKSYWNSLNYKSNSLHRKAILSNFVMQGKTAKRYINLLSNILVYCRIKPLIKPKHKEITEKADNQ